LPELVAELNDHPQLDHPLTLESLDNPELLVEQCQALLSDNNLLRHSELEQAQKLPPDQLAEFVVDRVLANVSNYNP